MSTPNPSNLYLDRYGIKPAPAASGYPEPAAVDFDAEYGAEYGTYDFFTGAGLASLQNGASPARGGGIPQDQYLQQLEEAMGMEEGGELPDPAAAAEAKAQGQAKEKAEAYLKQVEADVAKDEQLSNEQRDKAKRKLGELRNGLEQDPELPVEEELASLVELLDAHRKRSEAISAEADRASGKAAAIGDAVNRELSTDRSYWGGDEAGALAAIGDPLGEEGSPESGLINADPEAKNLDLVLQGKSGLENSQVPGKVAEILYDTALDSDQQINALKDALSELPRASQTYVLARVVKEIQGQDPEKLQFLSEQVPEVLTWLKGEIKYGKDAIEQGSLAQEGTRFTGLAYVRYDTDTHWYTNDWDDVTIPFGELTQGMGNVLHDLEAAEQRAAKPEEPSEF